MSGMHTSLTLRGHPHTLSEDEKENLCSTSAVSLVASTGHSEDHGNRLALDGIGANGRKVVQIRWGYF